MQRSLAVLALLLAASVANAQLVSKIEERAQIAGSATRKAKIPFINTSGRKLLSDGAALTPAGQSYNVKVCSATTPQFGTLPSPYEQLGELIYDNAVCATSTTRGKVTYNTTMSAYYGASAQDFGAAKPDWQTYGWALFKAPAVPDADKDTIQIQGLQFQIIGNVGEGTSVTCTLNGVSVAIFNADQSSPYDPTTTVVYSQTIALPKAPGTAWTWNSNTTAVIYTDLVDDLQSRINLTPGNYYWLRLKFNVPYAGAGSGKCLAFWALSSDMNTGAGVTSKCRWQESVGGSKGFSTTCLGAPFSGDNSTGVPGEHQTFFNCWNNGISATLGSNYRRCLTFRNQMLPALAAADCGSGAQFNDFNYAFTGFMGESGSGGAEGGL